MAAGVVYSGNAFDVERELYQTKTGYRLSGGFIPANGEIETLSAKAELPTLCPIQLDFNARSFKVVRNIKVYAAAASGATTVKIEKGSSAKVGDKFYLSESEYITISAIDKTNVDYDSLTVGALTAAIAAATVLITTDTVTSYNTHAVANSLLYTKKKIESGMSVTALGQAYEIDEANLYIPLRAEDKAGLTSRFMFV